MTIDADALGIPFARTVNPSLVSAGQPDQAGLERAKAAGITNVINLRPAAEDPSFDTGAAARALGMTYHELPIAGLHDFTPARVREFDGLLKQAGSTPTLVHCASGNRVGAIFALRARWLQNKSAEAALQEGANAGMTRMAAQVEPLLRAPVPG